MAKMAPIEVVIKVEGLESVKKWAAEAQSAAWESGMRHALAWLGLKQYGNVMANDNPHKEAE